MAEMRAEDLTALTVAHYRDKLAMYGPTPMGVDWNGAEAQELHFLQLTKILPDNATERFTINDLGCGYGAFEAYLRERRANFDYYGYDLNADLVDIARSNARREGREFEVANSPTRCADYGVASGIFTLRLGRSDEECWQSMCYTLARIDQTSRRGFAFNCLTSYSDPEKMKEKLYYPDPCAVFHHCKTQFARNVALLHDYKLYAFTILVRKELDFK